MLGASDRVDDFESFSIHQLNRQRLKTRRHHRTGTAGRVIDAGEIGHGSRQVGREVSQTKRRFDDHPECPLLPHHQGSQIKAGCFLHRGATRGITDALPLCTRSGTMAMRPAVAIIAPTKVPVVSRSLPEISSTARPNITWASAPPPHSTEELCDDIDRSLAPGDFSTQQNRKRNSGVDMRSTDWHQHRN